MGETAAFLNGSLIDDDFYDNSGFPVLKLQYRLRELGYPLKLTNLVTEELVEVLKEMDLGVLKDNLLFTTSQSILKHKY